MTNSRGASPLARLSPSRLSLAARLLQAQDAERRRISRDLHDSLGQVLAALKMELSKVARSGGPPLASSLQTCFEFIDEAVRECRTLSFLLHPPVLDLSGLAAAIREYAEGLDKRSKMAVRVEIAEPLPRLSPEKETALFRVVQESLTNVHRHSEAKNAWVRAHFVGSDLRLEVHDDGHGIANLDMAFTAETRPTFGVGIPGMRERLRELGGSLEIRSSPHGTHIVATLPGAEAHSQESASAAGSSMEPKQAPARGRRRNAVSRILVVDDHELMRRGVRALIENEPDLEVCGEAEDISDAEELACILKPDVILLDLTLPSGSGWEVVRAIRRFDFWTKVLVFSAYDNPATEHAAKAARCEGFVAKSRASSTLVEALRTILNGSTFFSENGGEIARAKAAP